jgi:N-acetylneuraminic acid mutarotase
MSKSVALLFVLFFLTALCVMVAKPVSSSAEVTEDSWVAKAPMHVARGKLGVAVVNGKIYAIGGDARSGEYPYVGSVVDTNEEYDPENDTWTFKASMPTPRYGFAIAVYQNKIYCIGGITRTGWVGTAANEVYDPATDTWENKTAMPTARFELQANVVNGKIYLIGGKVPGHYDFPNWTSSLNEVYDPATDSWTTKAPIPVATSYYPSAVVDNKIYIIGGHTDPYSNVNQIYDPETDMWSKGATPPWGIRYATAGATSGVDAPKRIYVLVEKWSLWEDEPPYSNRVYYPENDSWTFGADLPLPIDRQGFSVAVVSDILYVIGGFKCKELFLGDIRTQYATNLQYTPFGYGTVPPVVQVVSPENMTYTSGNVSLAFTVNKPVVWLGYSLDGEENVAIMGNTTLTGLASDLHNITVYTKDEFGNMGVSETVSFTVEAPFPATLVVAPVASVAVVGAVLAIYFKKRKTVNR